jgi:iron complex outermembrane receptor protein
MRFSASLTWLTATLCASVPALAQQSSRITGTVRTADGAPVVGAQVTVIGDRRGAITRDDGRYIIEIDPGTYRLKAARIGFTPDSSSGIVVAAGATVTHDFTLKASSLQISGVVVVGYGTRDARDRTGSVETVTAKDFNPGRVVSAEQLIQAKVPGVQVIDNNEPGGGISIRIRGGTSVNASNEPLFVIDGVPLQVGGGISAGRNPLNFLNPSDILSISVLKDASATAIYGSRGANGVVLITTRSGGAGTPSFTYSTSFSSSQIVKSPSLLNATQYRAAVQTYAPENLSKLGTASTDWLGAIERTAGGAEHNMSVAGAKDDMHYRFSLGWLDQNGILQGTEAKRITTALSYSDLLFKDKLDFRLNIKGSKADDFYTPGGVLGAATAMAPTQPIKNADGTYFQWSDPLGANNPLSDLGLLQDRGTTYRTIGDIETKYKIPGLDGLTATLRTGFDYTQAARTTFSPSTAQQDVESGRGGRIDGDNPRQLNTLLEIFGTYARKVGNSGDAFDATVGYTYEQSNGNFEKYYAQGLSTNLLGINGIPSATSGATTLDIQDSKLISFFGRANYTFHDRFLLTASIRRDGSSRFGPGNQWGLFPSFAGAWRIIEEPWFSKVSWLSDLKLRASWGVNGNQSFGNYLFLPTYTVGGAQAQYQFGNQYITTIRPSAVDPNIKWEQTTSTNFGLDFGFLNDRLTGTLDVYNKTTKDLIFTVPVAAGTNLSNFVTTNIGSMKNSGVELGLSAVILQGKATPWRWTAGFAISTNANKITSISGAGSDQILTGGIAGGVGNTIQVLKPGYPINSFFVYRHKTGADGKPVTGDKTDDQLYVDTNGDGTVNASDLVPYKSPQPKWIIGHTSTGSYKMWDFSLTARAYLGNYVYNNVASNLGNYSVLKGASPGNLQSSVLTNGFTKAQYFSDLYIEDASFLRLDNVSVGYTFKNLWDLRNVRIHGAVQNVFTSTKYTGVDPVAGVNGIDNNLFPLSRTYSLGISVGF